jgi:hypothetical protein
MADHPHTIDRWDDTTGETLIEQIAAVGDYLVALEIYRAAVQRWPNVKITLRNRARVIEQSWGVNRAVAPPIGAAVVVDVAGPQVRPKLFANPQRYSWAIWVKRERCVAGASR